MKAKLISLDSQQRRRQIVLGRLPVVVGRGSNADIRLDDRWASRAHCEIDEIDGVLMVHDLESRNGTIVNGQYVTQAHLMPGDRLTIGITSFKVHYKHGKPMPSVDAGHQTTSSA